MSADLPLSIVRTPFPTLSSQQFPDRFGEYSFDFRRDVRGRRACFIASLFIGDACSNVPRRVIAIRGHRDEQVGSLGFGSELIFNKGLAGQMHNPGPTECQTGDIEPMA